MMHLRFIHIVSVVPFIAEQNSSVWMCQSLFMHFLVEGRLGCYQFLANTNKASLYRGLLYFPRNGRRKAESTEQEIKKKRSKKTQNRA